MMRFMVCDTDVTFVQRMAQALHQQYDPCSVEYMYGPDALRAALCSKKSSGDILITEIELRKQNAIEIIQRDLSAHTSLQIIYMSSGITHCSDTYRTPHIGFLSKPVVKSKLEEAVDRGMANLEKQRKDGVLVQRGSQLLIIDPVNIIHMESHGRTLRIVTDTEVVETYEKLSQIQEQMDNRFLQCHKSYLINMDCVRQYTGDTFLMKNGLYIPVSQSKRKLVREHFMAYTQNIPLNGEPIEF